MTPQTTLLLVCHIWMLILSICSGAKCERSAYIGLPMTATELILTILCLILFILLLILFFISRSWRKKTLEEMDRIKSQLDEATRERRQAKSFANALTNAHQTNVDAQRIRKEDHILQRKQENEEYLSQDTFVNSDLPEDLRDDNNRDTMYNNNNKSNLLGSLDPQQVANVLNDHRVISNEDNLLSNQPIVKALSDEFDDDDIDNDSNAPITMSNYNNINNSILMNNSSSNNNLNNIEMQSSSIQKPKNVSNLNMNKINNQKNMERVASSSPRDSPHVKKSFNIAQEAMKARQNKQQSSPVFGSVKKPFKKNWKSMNKNNNKNKNNNNNNNNNSNINKNNKKHNNNNNQNANNYVPPIPPVPPVPPIPIMPPGGPPQGTNSVQYQRLSTVTSVTSVSAVSGVSGVSGNSSALPGPSIDDVNNYDNVIPNDMAAAAAAEDGNDSDDDIILPPNDGQIKNGITGAPPPGMSPRNRAIPPKRKKGNLAQALVNNNNNNNNNNGGNVINLAKADQGALRRSVYEGNQVEGGQGGPKSKSIGMSYRSKQLLAGDDDDDMFDDMYGPDPNAGEIDDTPGDGMEYVTTGGPGGPGGNGPPPKPIVEDDDIDVLDV